MAQVYSTPIAREFTDTGVVGVKYRLFFYETGTSTKKTVYSDEALTTPLTNPVVADATGRFVQIFMEGTGDDYKVVLAAAGSDDPPTSPIWTADPVNTSVTNDINAFGARPAQHWGTTSGSSTVYTLTPDTGLGSYNNKLFFSMQMHVTNGASPTLAISDLNNPGGFLAAKAIKKYDNAGLKVVVDVGDLQSSQRYIVTYDGTDFIVLNPGIEEYTKTNKFNGNSNAVEISSGAVAYASLYMVIDGEGSSNDDLDTISGGNTGDLLIMSPASGVIITVKHATGNIKLSGGIDIILSTTEDKLILQYDGSNWVELTKSVGTSVTRELIASDTASGSATIDLTWTNDSNYSTYILEIDQLVPATDDTFVDLLVSEDGGSTWKSGASDYKFGLIGRKSSGITVNSSNDAAPYLRLSDGSANNGVGNAAGEAYDGEARFFSPHNTSTHKKFRTHCSYDSGEAPTRLVPLTGGGSYYGTTNAINGVRITMSAGNITSGTFRLYRY
jgi:hypothetical protein